MTTMAWLKVMELQASLDAVVGDCVHLNNHMSYWNFATEMVSGDDEEFNQC